MQISVLSSVEDQCTHFKTSFSKHKNYILNILQQIIQSQRFKNVFPILEGAFKNANEWIRGNLHTDQIGREPSYDPFALREPRDGPEKAKTNRSTTFMLINRTYNRRQLQISYYSTVTTFCFCHLS